MPLQNLRKSSSVIDYGIGTAGEENFQEFYRVDDPKVRQTEAVVWGLRW